MKQTITVTIPEDHTVGISTKVEGVKGQSCRAVTGPIEKALGTVTDDVATPEFYLIPVIASEIGRERR